MTRDEILALAQSIVARKQAEFGMAPMTVEWSTDPEYSWARSNGPHRTIELMPMMAVADEARVIRSTLHEIGHILAHDRGKQTLGDMLFLRGHGFEFEKACHDLGLADVTVDDPPSAEEAAEILSAGLVRQTDDMWTYMQGVAQGQDSGRALTVRGLYAQFDMAEAYDALAAGKTPEDLLREATEGMSKVIGTEATERLVESIKANPGAFTMKRCTNPTHHHDSLFHKDREFEVSVEYDETMAEPWKEHDGHGIVSEWTSREKRPGERILTRDTYGHNHRYYDIQETTKLAKRDGWGLGDEDVAKLVARLGRHPSAGEIVAEAVDRDFERLRAWCNDEWHWCGVVVKLPGTKHSASLWGIDGDDQYDYIQEVARELADDILREVADEQAAVMDRPTFAAGGAT